MADGENDEEPITSYESDAASDTNVDTSVVTKRPKQRKSARSTKETVASKTGTSSNAKSSAGNSGSGNGVSTTANEKTFAAADSQEPGTANSKKKTKPKPKPRGRAAAKSKEIVEDSDETRRAASSTTNLPPPSTSASTGLDLQDTGPDVPAEAAATEINPSAEFDLPDMSPDVPAEAPPVEFNPSTGLDQPDMSSVVPEEAGIKTNQSAAEVSVATIAANPSEPVGSDSASRPYANGERSAVVGLRPRPQTGMEVLSQRPGTSTADHKLSKPSELSDPTRCDTEDFRTEKAMAADARNVQETADVAMEVEESSTPRRGKSSGGASLGSQSVDLFEASGCQEGRRPVARKDDDGSKLLSHSEADTGTVIPIRGNGKAGNESEADVDILSNPTNGGKAKNEAHNSLSKMPARMIGMNAGTVDQMRRHKRAQETRNDDGYISISGDTVYDKFLYDNAYDNAHDEVIQIDSSPRGGSLSDDPIYDFSSPCAPALSSPNAACVAQTPFPSLRKIGDLAHLSLKESKGSGRVSDPPGDVSSSDSEIETPTAKPRRLHKRNRSVLSPSGPTKSPPAKRQAVFSSEEDATGSYDSTRATLFPRSRTAANGSSSAAGRSRNMLGSAKFGRDDLQKMLTKPVTADPSKRK